MQPTQWSTAGFGPKTPSSAMKRGFEGLGRRTPSSRTSRSPWTSEGKSASISIFVDKEFDERRNAAGEPIKYYSELLDDNGEELQFEEARLRFARKAEAMVKQAEKQASGDAAESAADDENNIPAVDDCGAASNPTSQVNEEEQSDKENRNCRNNRSSKDSGS